MPEFSKANGTNSHELAVVVRLLQPPGRPGVSIFLFMSSVIYHLRLVLAYTAGKRMWWTHFGWMRTLRRYYTIPIGVNMRLTSRHIPLPQFDTIITLLSKCVSTPTPLLVVVPSRASEQISSDGSFYINVGCSLSQERLPFGSVLSPVSSTSRDYDGDKMLISHSFCSQMM